MEVKCVDCTWQAMVHGNYYVTPIVCDEFSKKILTLTYVLNVLIGHYLDFTEADWSALLSREKAFAYFIQKTNVSL